MGNNIRVRNLALLVAAMLTASCAGSDSPLAIEAIQADSDEAISLAQEQTQAARAAADASAEALADAESTIKEQAASIEQLAGELNLANDKAAELEGVVAGLNDRLEDAQNEISLAERRQAEAEDQVAELRARYDTELRADAQVAWEQEVDRACAEAGNGAGAIRNFVTYTDELGVIGTKAELVALVSDCAQPLRERSEQEKLDARCERGSVDQVTKGPDELAGNCYIVYVVPWQWDSRTGLCNFLGSWDGSNLGTRSFNYDGDGLFRAPPDVCSDDLVDADQDDLLQVWVDLAGSYRYDTAAGGTNEIPDFTVLRAVLITKA